jgi:hypothetical protein
MTTLLDFAATDEVILSGKRMVGAVRFRCARTSNLLRAVRFGADRFGAAPPCTINGVQVDIAGLYVSEFAPDDWRTHGHGYVRRYGEMGDAPNGVITALRDWALETAPTLAEANPDAFTRYGIADPADQWQYAYTSTFHKAAEQFATVTAILYEYAGLFALVDDGEATIEPRHDGDPVKVRWATTWPMREHVHGLDMPQPAPVVGRVMLDGRLIGWAVDARPSGYWHQHPDAINGPLLVPIEQATREDRH